MWNAEGVLVVLKGFSKLAITVSGISKAQNKHGCLHKAVYQESHFILFVLFIWANICAPQVFVLSVAWHAGPVNDNANINIV